MPAVAQPRFSPCGLATGIGSLPFEDPQKAVALILETFSACPHWPQLPRRSQKEHFVHQFLQPLVTCGILVSENQRWFFDLSRNSNAEALTDIYTMCMAAEQGDEAALKSFLPQQAAAGGLHAFLSRISSEKRSAKTEFLKGQVAGPLTIALQLKDEQDRPAYYHGDLRDIVVRTLALNARAQAAAFSSAGLVPIVFVDDPAVGAIGTRLHLALDREPVLEDLNFIFEAIHAEGGLAGIHSCEAIDWSLLTETTVDIISVDSYRFGSSLFPYSAQLCDFLQQGKSIAWGIVPTVDDPFKESSDSLLQKLVHLWDELFADRVPRHQICCQSMITPACGTGLLSVEQARHIYRLTIDLSRRVDAIVKSIVP